MQQRAKDGSSPEVRGQAHPAVAKFYKTEVKAALGAGGGVETAVNTGRKPWRELCIEFKD